MIYPYTIVKSKDIDFIYNFLKENGFKLNTLHKVDFYKTFDCVFCVIDDGGVFGKFCFYIDHNQLDKNRLRDLVDIQEFICKIYELLNINES